MAAPNEEKQAIKLSYGKPWEVVAKFSSFKAADLKRQKILMLNERVDAKVQRKVDCFVVKTRLKEEYFEKPPSKSKKQRKNVKKKLQNQANKQQK